MDKSVLMVISLKITNELKNVIFGWFDELTRYSHFIFVKDDESNVEHKKKGGQKDLLYWRIIASFDPTRDSKKLCHRSPKPSQ